MLYDIMNLNREEWKIGLFNTLQFHQLETVIEAIVQTYELCELSMLKLILALVYFLSIRKRLVLLDY